jgi:TPR repeat protein
MYRRHRLLLIVAAAALVAPGCGGSTSRAPTNATTTTVAPAPFRAPPGVDADIRACVDGKLEHCVEVAHRLDSPEADPSMRAKLAREFSPGCERSVPEDCFRAALFSDTPDTMITLLERACTGGVRLACRTLGETLGRDAGTAEQLAQSVAFFTHACELGDPPSCFTLGRTYDQGGPGLARDVAQAESFFKRGCEDLHDQASCRAAARLGCKEGHLEDCAVPAAAEVAH